MAIEIPHSQPTKYNHDNVIKQQPSLNSSLAAIPDYTNEVFSELLPEMPKSPFDINESIGDKYGDIADLLFSDDVREMIPIEPQDQLYRTVLKKTYGNSGISPHENIQGKYYLALACTEIFTGLWTTA